MKKNPVVCGDMPPLEVWADGIGEYVSWRDGKYHVKPGAPDWVSQKLEDYNSLFCAVPDENGIITQY